jgi:hypothetical protein
MPPDGIRTRNPRKRAASDPCFRPRGHYTIISSAEYLITLVIYAVLSGTYSSTFRKIVLLIHTTVGGTMILRNVDKYLSVGIAQSVVSLESSAAPIETLKYHKFVCCLVGVCAAPVKRCCPVVKDIPFS